MGDEGASGSAISLNNGAMWLLIAAVVLNFIYMGLVGLFAPMAVVAVVVYVILLGAALLLLIDRPWATWVTLTLFILDILQRGGYWYMNDAQPKTTLDWVILVLSVGLTVTAISYLANNVRGISLVPRARS